MAKPTHSLLLGIAIAIVACKSKPQKPATQHRDRAMACSPHGPGEPKADSRGECQADADCTAGKNGRCNNHGDPHAGYENRCGYDACQSDADCPDKGVCECGNNTGNACVRANCRTDADCGDSQCSPSHGCRYWLEGYYCHGADDDCVDNNDCKDGKQCVYRGEVGHWSCVNLQCPVG